MSEVPPGRRYDALRASVFAALPDEALRQLAGEVYEMQLPAGRLMYDAEVTVVASGLLRAFVADETGRQITVTYLRPGNSVALAHLAGRRYPTAFQAVVASSLIMVGNERALELQRSHPAIGWATAREFTAHLDEIEAELARFAFGSLRQRLAHHLLAMTADNSQPNATTGGSQPLPIHLAQLTNAVGSPREVVSRALSVLSNEGTVSVDATGVTVTDRERLEGHAQTAH